MRTSWWLCVGVMLWAAVLAGCGDDDTSGAGSAPGPLDLTAVQLEELPPAAGDAAELMGADAVDHDKGVGSALPVELPPSTAVETQQYWSTDTGGRTLGESPVDLVSVTLALLEDEAGVQPVIDGITGIDPEYVQWVPASVRGATSAQQSVAIPYEGEPTDEPGFSTIVARRDRLVVSVTAAGVDAESCAAAAIGVAELVLERAGEFSS